MQEACRRVLRGETGGATRSDAGTGTRVGVTPAQLPPVTAAFTARDEERAQLRDRLRAAGDGPARCGIAGMGGIGKTTLAVTVGHEVAAGFPDGQLFADLRGGGPEPADPGRVLGAFLRALGLAAAAVPDGTNERSALFRSRVADRRILVVLDNAASEAQVQPLLPAGPGCAALITSRALLPALDGVRWTELGLLSRSEGIRLLRAVAGADAFAESEAAGEVVDLCGRLPLAVRIAGARILGRPHWTLNRLAAALRDERGRLDELSIGDLAVRGSLRLSRRALPDDAARLFRRLGLLDDGDFNAWLAATLLDVPVAAAERVIDRLVDAQLLLVSAPGPGRHLRYRLHDLVRLNARERVDAEEPPAERSAALVRTWTALADIATEADRRSPLRILTATGSASPAERPVDDLLAGDLLADPAAWFDAERGRLVSAARAAAAARAGDLAWRIPAAALLAFQTRGLFHDWRDSHRRGLRAAVVAGDPVGRAVMHRNLALLDVFGGGGDWRRGLAAAGVALALFRRTGRRHGEVDALFLMSAAHLRLGDSGTALPPAEEGLRLARATGDRRAEANLLHHVGWIHRMNGRIDTALDHLRQGLRLADDGGFTRLHVWLSLAVGIVHREQGDLAAAEHHLRRALAAARQTRTDGDVASILNHLAALQRRRADPAAAQATAEEGLRLSRAVGLAFTEAEALLTLGETQTDLGAGKPARDLLVAARDQFAEVASAHGRARAWKALGVAEDLDGQSEAARAARLEARRLFAELGSTAEVRALDAALEP